LEREACRASCKGDKKRLSRGDPVTVMNVEEWGILLVTVPSQCSDGRMLLGECRIDQPKMEE